MEVWKDVVGYEGHYKVSDLGKVKSLIRKGRLKEMLLKPADNGKGYLFAVLTRYGIRKQYYLHSLVAQAFLKHIPIGHKIVVDHKNNIKTDNRIENLQLISQRENCSKNRKGGTSKYIGVSWNSRHEVWLSQIIINGKSEYLGYFTNELEAANAYQDRLNQIVKPIIL